VIATDAEELGRLAAAEAIAVLQRAIAERGEARVIVATGNSQLTFFQALREARGLDWSRVRLFHMDEYVGIDERHPASFRAFLRREVVEPLGVRHAHFIEPDVLGIEGAMAAYADLLSTYPVDLTCMGIGENGHLAFNDPPFADFHDPEVIKEVQLDDRSIQQQVGEGHFPNIDAVPRTALTLTIPTLLKPPRVLVIVPEQRKADAVARALHGAISNDCPASCLRTAEHATLYLDDESASKLA
jgi:glucosamine-6-phosphate deaminase